MKIFPFDMKVMATPFYLWADFNMYPQCIIDSGFAKLIQAVIKTPDIDSTISGIIDFAMHSQA